MLPQVKVVRDENYRNTLREDLSARKTSSIRTSRKAHQRVVFNHRDIQLTTFAPGGESSFQPQHKVNRMHRAQSYTLIEYELHVCCTIAGVHNGRICRTYQCINLVLSWQSQSDVRYLISTTNSMKKKRKY